MDESTFGEVIGAAEARPRRSLAAVAAVVLVVFVVAWIIAISGSDPEPAEAQRFVRPVAGAGTVG